MSRSLITATVVALSFSSLFSASALAACADADQCTPAVCRQRQAPVHGICDVPRSCAGINANNKPELRRRLTINQRCLAARQNVGLCFSVVDQGHTDAINGVQAVIDVCQDKIDQ